MQRSARRTACVLMALVATGGLGACGKDDKGDGRRGADGRGGADSNGEGTISASYTAFPDFLDPALSYTSEGWQTLWTVYTPLLTYRHAEGADGSEVIPGLAEKLPEISDGGRTYKLRLRAGLRYSDGAPVRAADFEHTVKRVLNLESGGSRFFEKIAGAGDYVKGAKARADISGIVTNDRTRDITIRLAQPDGSFSNILALDFAGLVPGDTPFSNQTKSPPPGVGPFRLANVKINRGYDLVRNPRFDIDGLPQAKLHQISVSVVKNRRRQTQSTIRNRTDYMNDPPAPDEIRGVRDRFEGKRYKEFSTNSTYFFFLNERVAPFDDQRVRQAVNFAVDKRALARLYGGLLAPSCNFLPPGMKGYEKLDPCPYGDPEKAPNVARAKALVASAGAAAKKPVIVYGLDEPEAQRVAQYLADVLNRIGLKARPRIVESSVYYTTIGNQQTKAQTGFANFFEDYPHPSNFLALVDGGSITPTNNTNFGNTNDPVIDRGLARLDRNPDLDAVADGYAALDRRLVTQAHLVPYGQRKLTVFMSDRMRFGDECNLVHPVYNSDFTSFCLK